MPLTAKYAKYANGGPPEKMIESLTDLISILTDAFNSVTAAFIFAYFAYFAYFAWFAIESGSLWPFQSPFSG